LRGPLMRRKWSSPPQVHEAAALQLVREAAAPTRTIRARSR
jgi:hypothetical protein